MSPSTGWAFDIIEPAVRLFTQFRYENNPATHTVTNTRK
jgi:hypothetical protein